MTFYDSNGKAIAYTEDNENIFLFNGTPVAFLYTDAVYKFNGMQLGTFENGWVRDFNGNCVFFTEEANGQGPVKPVKHVKPVKSVKQVKPAKGVKQVKRVKAVKLLNWSELSGVQFFR